MNTPETMTDFSNLTPPAELVREWHDLWFDGPRQWQNLQIAKPSAVSDHDLVATLAARWGAEQAAERLANQWPTPITDRPPTEADGDDKKRIQFIFEGRWSQCLATHWDGEPWRHTPRWQPPAPPTLKEQALKLLEPEGTPARVLNEDQISLIRRALEADS